MTFINDHIGIHSHKNPILYSKYEEEEAYPERNLGTFEIETNRFSSWCQIEDRNIKFYSYTAISVSKSSIDMAIERAKEMFIIDENDEPDVYPTEYAQKVAFTFLINLTEKADISVADLPAPTIAAAEQNSIDLIWELQETELTINFPSSNQRKIGFIGENKGGDRLRGAISADQGQVNFLDWLLQ